MNRNRIELFGKVTCAPEMRATPTGTPVMRIELDCGEGREPLRLGVVMIAGERGERGRSRRGLIGSTIGIAGICENRVSFASTDGATVNF